MRIQFIKYIHEKILIEGTGSPKELALLLNTSERTIYIYTICHAISILFIKMQLNQKWSTATIKKNVENPKSHKSRKKTI
jgi:hypothetical protein